MLTRDRIRSAPRHMGSFDYFGRPAEAVKAEEDKAREARNPEAEAIRLETIKNAAADALNAGAKAEEVIIALKEAGATIKEIQEAIPGAKEPKATPIATQTGTSTTTSTTPPSTRDAVQTTAAPASKVSPMMIGGGLLLAWLFLK